MSRPPQLSCMRKLSLSLVSSAGPVQGGRSRRRRIATMVGNALSSSCVVVLSLTTALSAHQRCSRRFPQDAFAQVPTRGRRCSSVQSRVATHIYLAAAMHKKAEPIVLVADKARLIRTVRGHRERAGGEGLRSCSEVTRTRRTSQRKSRRLEERAQVNGAQNVRKSSSARGGRRSSRIRAPDT